jgi:plastocyanin
MTNLHPHWQTTDDDQPVRVSAVSRNAPAQKQSPKIPRAKRSPAAFIGILVFLGIGFYAFGGMNSLLGQATTSIDVTIMQDTMNPSSITVQPGQTITWKNSSTIPHILHSDTLRDDRSLAFESTAIFPQGTYSFTIPTNTPSGSYAYISKTSPSINGVIVVSTNASATTQTVSSAPAQPVAPIAQASSSSFAPIPAATTPVVSSSSAAAVSQVPEQLGQIQTNPHTIANGSDMLPPRAQPGTNVSGNVMQHTPTSQPTTGPGMWLTVCLGASSLWVVMKRAMKFA